MTRVTGSAPVSCPWAATVDPFVRDVMRVAGHLEDGLSGPLTGGWDRAPRRLVEGLAVYVPARSAAEAHAHEVRQRRAEAERRAREAVRRGR